MQKLTEKAFNLVPPGGLFDDSVIRNLFPGSSEGARKLFVHRAVHSKEVLRLKPGLYCLAEPYRKTHPHPFLVAAVLHSPSHISLESALSFHGLIPEAVREITSVTVSRSRTFKNPLGVFSFVRVPANDPRAGVQAIELEPNAWAFVATPLRAIADLVYVRKEVLWRKDGLGFLIKSMRIEEDDLLHLEMDDFEVIKRSIRNLRVKDYLEGIQEATRR